MYDNEYYYIYKDEFINPKKIELKYIPDKINLSRKKVDEMADLYLRCLKAREIKKSIDINNIYSSILEQIKKAVINGDNSVLIYIKESWTNDIVATIKTLLAKDGFLIYDLFSNCLRISGWT